MREGISPNGLPAIRYDEIPSLININTLYVLILIFLLSGKYKKIYKILPLPSYTIPSIAMKTYVSICDIYKFKCQKDMGEDMRVDFPVGEYIYLLLGIIGGIHKYSQSSTTLSSPHLIFRLHLIVDEGGDFSQWATCNQV